MRNTTSDLGATHLQILRAICRCEKCGRKGPARASRPVFRCMRGKAPFRYEGKEVGMSTARQACPCGGRLLVVREIEGRVTDHKCGAKCLESKGHVCECACGGANHGQSHAFA